MAGFIQDAAYRLSGLWSRRRGVRCAHLDRLRDVTPSSRVCDECIALGDTWVDLRLCLECGNVACCNDSRNRHARRHFEVTGHPVMRSFEPGETWRWCWVDEVPV